MDMPPLLGWGLPGPPGSIVVHGCPMVAPYAAALLQAPLAAADGAGARAAMGPFEPRPSLFIPPEPCPFCSMPLDADGEDGPGRDEDTSVAYSLQRAMTDLWIVFVVSLVTFTAVSVLGLVDRFLMWAEQYPWLRFDTGFVLATIVATAFSVVVLKRWMEYSEAVRGQQRSHRQARQRDARYRSLVRFSSDAIVQLDASGRVIEWNRGAERLFGRVQDRVVGMSIAELLPDRYRRAIREGLERYLEEGSSDLLGSTLEMHVLHASGREVPVEATFDVWRTPEGVFFAAIMRDITPRRAEEVQSHRERELLELASATARAANEAETVEEAFQVAVDAVCSVTGWPVGHAYVDLEGSGRVGPVGVWHLEDPDRYRPFVEASEGLRFGEGEGLVGAVLRTGEDVWSSDLGGRDASVRAEAARRSGLRAGCAFPVRVQGDVVAVIEFYMETDEPPADHIREAMEPVGSQLGRVIERKRSRAKLDEYARELERRNEELEQFGYVVSHDLREPLRMVRSYLQLLERRYGDQLGEDAEEFIDFAVDGAERMDRLIQDLLEFSRVGTRGEEPEPFDAERGVEVALQNLEVAVDESGAEIEVGDLPAVMADGDQLVQVFQNLIHNAIKFSGEEVPRVEITGLRRDGWVEFAVRDEGVGIPEEARDRVFVAFQRLGARDDVAGTGIGLAICKRIIERHGGRIWVESAKGKGSVFRFTMPVAAGQGEEE